MQPDLLIFPVVTHTVQSNARTGIQTVTRGLCAGLREMNGSVPMAWHARKRYLHGLKSDWSRNLGEPIPCFKVRHSIYHPKDWLSWLLSKGRHSHTPLHWHPEFRDQLRGAWLLLPELMDDLTIRAIRKYARHHHMKVAALFHDAIPLLRPDLTERTPEAHESYMRALAELDLVLPVSEFSATELRRYLSQWKVAAPSMEVCSLAAEISGQKRIRSTKNETHDAVHLLCVSTLEPRKGHKLLIDSFLSICKKNPLLKLTLHLVGDRFEKAPEIAQFIENIQKKYPSIIWHENVDHFRLRELYELCDFTVYPSFLEGFGLPVCESLWFARPCICANFGVMSENARGGGCLTVDVRQEKDLAGAIEQLTFDLELRTTLARQAVARPLSTWVDYAKEVTSLLNVYSQQPRGSGHESVDRPKQDPSAF